MDKNGQNIDGKLFSWKNEQNIDGKLFLWIKMGKTLMESSF